MKTTNRSGIIFLSVDAKMEFKEKNTKLEIILQPIICKNEETKKWDLECIEIMDFTECEFMGNKVKEITEFFEDQKKYRIDFIEMINREIEKLEIQIKKNPIAYCKQFGIELKQLKK